MVGSMVRSIIGSKLFPQFIKSRKSGNPRYFQEMCSSPNTKRCVLPVASANWSVRGGIFGVQTLQCENISTRRFYLQNRLGKRRERTFRCLGDQLVHPRFKKASVVTPPQRFPWRVVRGDASRRMRALLDRQGPLERWIALVREPRVVEDPA